jgi:nitrous oxidase accessory protein NosD
MKKLCATVLGLALLLVGGAPQAATLTADCSKPGTDLQSVINSAKPGDVITVIGTCKGQFTVSQTLTLTGGPGDAIATLDGNHGGSVLTVNVASPGIVNLDDLIIINGTGTIQFEAVTAGGGIYNLSTGTLVLTNVQVRNNTATDGSGIYNSQGGLLTLLDSSVNHNLDEDPSGLGGGILMNSGSLILTGGSVSHNQTALNRTTRHWYTQAASCEYSPGDVVTAARAWTAAVTSGV